MGEKKVTETTNTQVSDVQPYVLHSPLVIAIEKVCMFVLGKSNERELLLCELVLEIMKQATVVSHGQN